MSTFLFRGQLIFKMNTRRPSLNHTLHEFEHIERAAKTGFGISDDRGKPVNVVSPLGVVNLIGALQGLINAPHNMRYTVRRIETLIGIHMSSKISISGNLPAAQVDRLQ